MSLSSVLFLFLTHLAVGIVFTLVFVARGAGVKFFRFNAGLAVILIAVALAFRYQGSDAEDDLSRLALYALLLSEAALVLYWATVGRMLAGIRPAIVVVAVGAGITAVLLQALGVSAGWRLAARALTVASFLSSA